MGIIHLLDQQTANSIAAGEVVERPSSVVKELVENALDAGATTITVEIAGGGILSIAVIDNGRGMASEDTLMAFSRHATSKIIRIEDLDTIGTLGFRGEALASIAAVAKVTLRSRQQGTAMGDEVRIEGGQLMHQGPAGCPEGTSIQVEQLFFNTPARFKFLKKDSTEAAAIAETVERLILSRPDVSFRLLTNGQELLHSPGNNDLLSAIYAVYGRKQAAACIPISGQSSPLQISGYIARPEGAKNNRSGQTVLVNGRWIRSRTVTAAIDEAYKSRLMKGRFAFTAIRIDLPPELVDVNVHPQKLEVRFWKDGEVFSAVYQTIVSALNDHAGILPSDSAENEDSREAPPVVVTKIVKDENLSVSDRTGSEYARNTFNEPDKQSLEYHNYVRPYEHHDGTIPIEFSSSESSLPIKEPVAAPQQVREQIELHNVNHSAALMKASELVEARLIGTLFNTYIMLELGDELIMVDQHAAHEKIIYERLRDAYRDAKHRRTQPLLIPMTLTVAPSELILLEAEQAFFEAIGFTLEPFGSNALIIRTIPDLQSARIDPESALRAALQSLIKAHPADHQAVNELLYQVACKAAVKAHDHLSALEIHQLIADLAPLENPYTCPHGRPVIIRMPRLELEKKFKRVL